MALKLFILGLPGSGKSTFSHYISDYVRERQWSTTHIHDYNILFQMFQEDINGHFESTAHDGFNVLHLPILDTALRELEQIVRKHLSTTQFEEIVLIEFSRNDYKIALNQFTQEFLQDAYFLYLNVDLDICKKRVRERSVEPNTTNDHYVSDYIFEVYYCGDNGKDLPQILHRNNSIVGSKVMVIDNNISHENFSNLNEQFKQFERFIDNIIANESQHLRETEPMRKFTDIEAQGELECN